MIRKLLVKIIASVYLTRGLGYIVVFFLPIFTFPKYFTLDVFAFLAGALGLWAGIYLFKLDEHGRKFAIALLFLRIASNLAAMVWMFLQKDLTVELTYLSRPLFATKSDYTFAIYLTIWAGIALAALLFLMQKETKAIFVSGTAHEEGSEPITKSISNP